MSSRRRLAGILSWVSLTLITFSAMFIPMPIRPFMVVTAVINALGVGNAYLPRGFRAPDPPSPSKRVRGI